MTAQTSAPLRRLLDRFVRDDRGATAIEYGMIAVFLSIAIAVTVFGLGGNLRTNYYQRIVDAVTAA